MLALLAVLADGAVRRYETGLLLDQVDAAQASLAYTDTRLRGNLSYVSRQLDAPDAPPAVRASLRTLLQDEAAGRLPALQQRRDAVAGVRVLPWHDAQRAARDDYLGYLDARADGLRAVAVDLDALFRRRPQFEQSLARARAAFRQTGSADQQARAARLLR